MLFIGIGKIASTSRYREEGFRQVMSESPSAFCHSMELNDGPLDTESVSKELMQTLNGQEPPTAVFCYNDNVARSISDILLNEGVKIPGDISIIGCGNIPVADSQLSLTTFDQHPEKVGRAAAKMYLERTREEGRSSGVRRERIAPELIVRGSTGPVA